MAAYPTVQTVAHDDADENNIPFWRWYCDCVHVGLKPVLRFVKYDDSYVDMFGRTIDGIEEWECEVCKVEGKFQRSTRTKGILIT